MPSYIYDSGYRDYADRISRASAEIITQILRSILPIESILDVGCARGTWLDVWRTGGVKTFMGMDGDYIDPNTLLVEREHFIGRDLTQPFTLGRRFDLVQCLEVAEHLPASRADGLVADLAAHGDVLLFSAAPPGQGGEYHINEQPYSYWRGLFAARGYVLVDCLRPILAGQSMIAPWYRYNLFLYMKPEKLSQVTPYLRWFEIGKDQPIPDFSPWPYRLRKAMIQQLPFFICQKLAKMTADRSS